MNRDDVCGIKARKALRQFALISRLPPTASPTGGSQKARRIYRNADDAPHHIKSMNRDDACGIKARKAKAYEGTSSLTQRR
ncbi:hypothetical protein [Bifidobacterium simiarum]|uniref:hypothetical protein n=1 Tax=Bifidobacterium simiarum TaxID=2045441 RepID=UPI001BDC250F|nr:hypothetical protein [Bifidobacterium simiarum]MBT1165553.1 hypothetical protein [Bifidobacterium simiarum]